MINCVKKSQYGIASTMLKVTNDRNVNPAPIEVGTTVVDDDVYVSTVSAAPPIAVGHIVPAYMSLPIQSLSW